MKIDNRLIQYAFYNKRNLESESHVLGILIPRKVHILPRNKKYTTTQQNRKGERDVDTLKLRKKENHIQMCGTDLF